MNQNDDNMRLRPISNRERKRRAAEKHNKAYEESKKPVVKVKRKRTRRGVGALVIATAMANLDITKLR